MFSSDDVPSILPNTVLETKMVEVLVKDSPSNLLPSQVFYNVPSEKPLRELIQKSVTNLLPSPVLTPDSPAEARS